MGLTLEQMPALTDAPRGAAHPLSPACRAGPQAAPAPGRVTRCDDLAYALQLAPTGQTRRAGSSPHVDPPVRRGDAAAGLRRQAQRGARSTASDAPGPLPVGVH